MNAHNLTIQERARFAYIENRTEVLDLLARIDELQNERDELETELEDLKDSATDDSLARWERENGSAEAYKEFFFSCFERLAGHYPCPEVSSEHDKSVIFNAIERGEECSANHEQHE